MNQFLFLGGFSGNSRALTKEFEQRFDAPTTGGPVVLQV